MTVESVLFATIMRMVEHQSGKFPVFSLVITEFAPEISSVQTASSANLLFFGIEHRRQASRNVLSKFSSTLRTDGADRNVFRSGSSTASESASLTIVARLSSQW